MITSQADHTFRRRDFVYNGRVRKLLYLALAALSACDGGDSTTPSSPGPITDSGTTVSGRVVGVISGNPVAGARVNAGGASATTDGSGAFRLNVPGAGDARVEVSGPGIITRNTFFRIGGLEPVFDLIEASGLWNLDFYRELCRDSSGGGSLKPLSPVTREPRVYVDRRPESGLNRPIPDSAVDTVREAIATVLPLLTRGKLVGAQVEVGMNPPPDRTPGTVVIRWNPVEVSQVAGAASGIAYNVGGDWNVVVLRNIDSTESIFHELGHVLGLYHPLGSIRPSYMIGSGVAERPHFTQWDIHHANILHARPPGNTDPDSDPAGFVVNGASGLTALGFQGNLMICR